MKKLHSHFFEHTSTMYEQAFQKIIIEHNTKYDLILHCECGETKKVNVTLKFDMDDEEDKK